MTDRDWRGLVEERDLENPLLTEKIAEWLGPHARAGAGCQRPPGAFPKAERRVDGKGRTGLATRQVTVQPTTLLPSPCDEGRTP